MKRLLFIFGIILMAPVCNAQTDKVLYTENAPEYPGCTGTNTEKKACFRKKIGEHLSSNFNSSDLVNKLNFATPGKRIVFIRFDIDTTGNIENIRIASRDSVLQGDEAKQLLKTEAIRVFKMVPKLQPASTQVFINDEPQKERYVSVPYGFRLAFMVE